MMRTLAAGPQGVLAAGAAVDLPDDQAEQLIAGGYATDLAQPAADPANSEPKLAETAMAGPDGNTAAPGTEATTEPAGEQRAAPGAPGATLPA